MSVKSLYSLLKPKKVGKKLEKVVKTKKKKVEKIPKLLSKKTIHKEDRILKEFFTNLPTGLSYEEIEAKIDEKIGTLSGLVRGDISGEYIRKTLLLSKSLGLKLYVFIDEKVKSKKIGKGTSIFDDLTSFASQDKITQREYEKIEEEMKINPLSFENQRIKFFRKLKKDIGELHRDHKKEEFKRLRRELIANRLSEQEVDPLFKDLMNNLSTTEFLKYVDGFLSQDFYDSDEFLDVFLAKLGKKREGRERREDVVQNIEVTIKSMINEIKEELKQDEPNLNDIFVKYKNFYNLGTRENNTLGKIIEQVERLSKKTLKRLIKEYEGQEEYSFEEVMKKYIKKRKIVAEEKKIHERKREEREEREPPIVKKSDAFSTFLRNNLTVHRVRPWLSFRFKKIWITTPDENTDENQANFEMYKQRREDGEEVYRLIEGANWFAPSDLFFVQSSKTPRNNINQIGKVLSIQGDVPIVMELCYELDDGKIIYQNEDIFRKEVEWFNIKEHDYFEQVEEFLSRGKKELEKATNINRRAGENDNLIRETMIEVLYKNLVKSYNGFEKETGKDGVSKYLSSHIKEDSEYKDFESIIIDDKVRRTAVEIESYIFNNFSDLSSYFTSIARVVTFLNPLYLGKYAYQFRMRIKLGFYDAEKIVSSDNKTIYREIFSTITDEEKIANYNSIIDTFVGDIKGKIITEILLLSNPRLLIPRLPDMFLFFDEISPTADCKNEDDARRIKVWDLITSGGYCFSIENLAHQFGNNNYINPYSKKKFSETLISRVKEYDSILKPYRERLEEEKREEKREAEAQSREEHKGIEEPPDLIKEIIDGLDNMESKLVEQASEDEICAYCRRHFSKESIRTAIAKGKETGIFKFCSMRCFEKWESPRKLERSAERKEPKVESRKYVERGAEGKVYYKLSLSGEVGEEKRGEIGESIENKKARLERMCRVLGISVYFVGEIFVKLEDTRGARESGAFVAFEDSDKVRQYFITKVGRIGYKGREAFIKIPAHLGSGDDSRKKCIVFNLVKLDKINEVIHFFLPNPDQFIDDTMKRGFTEKESIRQLYKVLDDKGLTKYFAKNKRILLPLYTDESRRWSDLEIGDKLEQERQNIMDLRKLMAREAREEREEKVEPTRPKKLREMVLEQARELMERKEEKSEVEEKGEGESIEEEKKSEEKSAEEEKI